MSWLDTISAAVSERPTQPAGRIAQGLQHLLDVLATGLPEPSRVVVKDRYAGEAGQLSIDIDVATHDDLDAWVTPLGVDRWAVRSQPYHDPREGADQREQRLTHATTRLCGVPIDIACCEFVDDICAREAGDPS